MPDSLPTTDRTEYGVGISRGCLSQTSHWHPPFDLHPINDQAMPLDLSCTRQALLLIACSTALDIRTQNVSQPRVLHSSDRLVPIQTMHADHQSWFLGRLRDGQAGSLEDAVRRCSRHAELPFTYTLDQCLAIFRGKAPYILSVSDWQSSVFFLCSALPLPVHQHSQFPSFCRLHYAVRILLSPVPRRLPVLLILFHIYRPLPICLGHGYERRSWTSVLMGLVLRGKPT